MFKIRFVASLLRGLSRSAFNLGTIHKLVASLFQQAAIDRRNTEAKELEKMLKRLGDPLSFLILIGLLQILECYSKTSLSAQSPRNFAVEVGWRIIEAKKELNQWKTNWTWSKEPLQMAGTAAPRDIVDRLLLDSTYVPHVPRKNLRKYKPLQEAGLLEEGQNFDELYWLETEKRQCIQ